MQKVNKHFIVIEGPDGIGKSTQVTYLIDWLNKQVINEDCLKTIIKGFKYKELNDSNYIFSDIRNLVYSLYKTVSTTVLAELIKINRYLVYSTLIQPLTDETSPYFAESGRLQILMHIALCDRWNISTYAYLMAEDFKEEALFYLHDEATVLPGLTIMLVGDNGCTRMANRPENNNMFEDRQQDYNIKLANIYKNFDTSLYGSKVVKINNDNLTKEQTRHLIQEIVTDYLKTLIS